MLAAQMSIVIHCVQGVLSPVLANVYLHYVLDLWFERKVRKGNRGQSRLFGFADDFVCCFDYRHEASAFEQAVKERLGKFGLELALDKTQTLRFGRGGGGHNGRFDFLGFEFRWEKSRTRGHAIVKRRTSRKKLRLKDNPGWNVQQARGMNLLGAHYGASRA